MEVVVTINDFTGVSFIEGLTRMLAILGTHCMWPYWLLLFLMILKPLVLYCTFGFDNPKRKAETRKKMSECCCVCCPHIFRYLRKAYSVINNTFADRRGVQLCYVLFESSNLQLCAVYGVRQMHGQQVVEAGSFKEAEEELVLARQVSTGSFTYFCQWLLLLT